MSKLPLCVKITHDIHPNHVICSWFYVSHAYSNPYHNNRKYSNPRFLSSVPLDHPERRVLVPMSTSTKLLVFQSTTWWKADKQLCTISVPVFQSLNLVVGNPGCAQIWEGQNMSRAKAAPKCPGKAGHWRSVCRNLSWTCFYDLVCLNWCNCPSWWSHVERTHLSGSCLAFRMLTVFDIRRFL